MHYVHLFRSTFVVVFLFCEGKLYSRAIWVLSLAKPRKVPQSHPRNYTDTSA